MANWTPWKDRPYVPLRDGKAPPPQPAQRPTPSFGGYDSAGLAQLLQTGVVPGAQAALFAPSAPQSYQNWDDYGIGRIQDTNEPEIHGPKPPDQAPPVTPKAPQVSSAPPQRAKPQGLDPEFQARLEASGFGPSYQYMRSPFGKA
jgi:hypothetical protein